MRINEPHKAHRALLVLVMLALGFGVVVHTTAMGPRAGGDHRIVPGHVARAVAAPEAAVSGAPRAAPEAKASAGGRELTAEERERFELGRSLYATCAVCHGAGGEGVGENPPLAGAPIAIGPHGRFARILIDGMTGPVSIGGKLYNGVMPAAQANDDEDLAAVMTFVRRSFGNAADPVTPADIATVKSETEDHAGRPWTAIELEKVE